MQMRKRKKQQNNFRVVWKIYYRKCSAGKCILNANTVNKR